MILLSKRVSILVLDGKDQVEEIKEDENSKFRNEDPAVETENNKKKEPLVKEASNEINRTSSHCWEDLCKTFPLINNSAY